MKIVRTRDELRAALAPHRLAGESIGFAPTMGFLHEGHMSLFTAASSSNDIAVASIFVNPTQFAPGEDLDSYPRDHEGDSAKAKACGIDYLWIPEDPSAMYAADHSSVVRVDGLTSGLCGRSRPSHFEGVTTVVAKLFNVVQPTRAYFGQKDYQQLAVIRRMVRDLDFPIEIVGMPIVRESDGLALSSRNTYLSSEDRQNGLALSKSLRLLTTLWEEGVRNAEALNSAWASFLEAQPGCELDYAELVHPETLAPLEGDIQQGAVAALAMRVGDTRLIDNARIDQKGSWG